MNGDWLEDAVLTRLKGLMRSRRGLNWRQKRMGDNLAEDIGTLGKPKLHYLLEVRPEGDPHLPRNVEPFHFIRAN